MYMTLLGTSSQALLEECLCCLYLARQCVHAPGSALAAAAGGLSIPYSLLAVQSQFCYDLPRMTIAFSSTATYCAVIQFDSKSPALQAAHQRQAAALCNHRVLPDILKPVAATHSQQQPLVLR